jgi:hypothetical protein
MSDNKLHQLGYIINHIFLPPELPQQYDHDLDNDCALCDVILTSAMTYRQSLPLDEQIRWDPIVKMLQSLYKFHDSDVFSKDSINEAVREMQPGGMLRSLFSERELTTVIRARYISAADTCPKCWHYLTKAR